MFTKGSIKNHRGQGTIEYILILVITIAILAGLGSQFYKPFGRFLENYMGEYLQCLLETGELPTLGAEADNLECAEFLAGGSLNGGGSGRGGRGSNRNGDEASQSKEDSERGSGGGAAGTAGGSRRGGRFMNTPNSASGVGEVASQADSKKKEIPYTGSDAVSSRSRTIESYREQGRKIRSIPISGMMVADQVRTERERNRIRQVGKSEDFGVEQKAKKILLKKAEKRTVLTEENVEWSFGRLFRIGLILIILISILLFLGGQALQISKNWE